VTGYSALRLESIWRSKTARTFVGRQAYLVRRARGEEAGDGDQKVPAAEIAQIGTGGRARLPAANNKGKVRRRLELGRERERRWVRRCGVRVEGKEVGGSAARTGGRGSRGSGSPG
jgi:hypothetical protein